MQKNKVICDNLADYSIFTSQEILIERTTSLEKLQHRNWLIGSPLKFPNCCPVGLQTCLPCLVSLILTLYMTVLLYVSIPQ